MLGTNNYILQLATREICLLLIAIIKVPDVDELYVNWAFVVLQNGTENERTARHRIMDELNKSIETANGQENLKKYEIPRNIVIVDELPRIAGTEKVDYNSLEQEANLLVSQMAG
jgi:acyl-coenzyme A synthetase/AMP-(fatty) acid ligase